MNWIAVLSSDHSNRAIVKMVVMRTIWNLWAHPSVVIVTMVYQKDAGMDSKVLPSTFWKKTIIMAALSSSSQELPFHNRTWWWQRWWWPWRGKRQGSPARRRTTENNLTLYMILHYIYAMTAKNLTSYLTYALFMSQLQIKYFNYFFFFKTNHIVQSCDQSFGKSLVLFIISTCCVYLVCSVLL